MMCSEESDCFQLPVFENRFTSNDLDELLHSFFQPETNKSYRTSTCNQPIFCDSGSEKPIIQTSEEMDEKKEKRKLSNRESAKRSRCRKKRHLENLTAQANRLKAQNRYYRNRLSSILYQLQVVRKENDRFRVESVGLLRRHSHLNRVLQFQYETNFVSNFRMIEEGNGPFLSLQRYSY